MRLRPFFSFYGAKWRIAPLYPAPKFNIVIEPFAGSACYSILHYHRKIQLFDVDPIICGIWDFLIRATDADISLIPDWIESVEELAFSQEVKWLVGFWLARANATPRLTASAWKRALHTKTETVQQYRSSFWGPWVKDRLRKQVPLIRHWTISQCSYSVVPNSAATWFVDPPYQGRAGSHYRYSSANIDYSDLATFATSRKGQTIVCESGFASWLPFKVLQVNLSSLRKNQNVEGVWTNETLVVPL